MTSDAMQPPAPREIPWTFWQVPRHLGESYNWNFLLKVDLAAIVVLLAFFALPPVRDWTGCDLRIIAAGFAIHYAFHVAINLIGLQRVDPGIREFLSHFVNLVAMVSIPLSSEKPLFALWLLYPLVVWMDGYGSPKSFASLLTSMALPWLDPLWHWGTPVAGDKAMLAGTSVVVGLVIYLVASYFTAWSLSDNARKAEEARLRAMETERERIGRSLHGTLGAALSEITLWHEVALAGNRDAAADAQAHDPLARAHERAKSALTELRSLLSGLDGEGTRGAGVAAADLAAGIRRQVDGLCAAAGVHVDFDADASGSAPPHTAYHVAKVVVEAVTNTVRHARATRVGVSLSLSPLSIEISDDGTGFDPSASSHGRGLRSLREHADALGATLALDTAPGQGTAIRVTKGTTA